MKNSAFNPTAFGGVDPVVRKYQKKYVRCFRPGQKVLDLGCGTGVFLELLREGNVNGVGVDSFEPSVRACREKHLDVHQSDIVKYLEKTKDNYDGIFCSHVIEHLTPQVVLRLLSNMNRVLNSNGLAVIITPNFMNIEVIAERFWLDITHVRPYPIPLLESMLAHTGFIISSSGLDKDTAQHFLRKNPLDSFSYLLGKLRWGKYYGRGDSFVIATKS